MCVVSKQFELLEFVFDSVYVDLKYDEIYLTFTAGFVCCVVCSHVVVFVLVLYVDAVVTVTVICVLLFMLHVCMLRKCKSAMVTAMLVWGRGRCGCCECGV